MAPGSLYCEHCGTKWTPPQEAICPKCGQPIKPGAEFCSFCGTPLGNTGNEPHEFDRREPPEEEDEDYQDLHYERPQAPPYEQPSFFEKNKKAVIGGIIALLIIAGGLFAWYSSSNDKDYTNRCIIIANELNQENESFTGNIKKLDPKGSDEDRDKTVSRLQENKRSLENLIKDHAADQVGDKHKTEEAAINDILHNQVDIYAAAIAVAADPKSSDANNKLDTMETKANKSKKSARSLHINGADFTSAVNMDSSIDALKKYVKDIAKAEEEKNTPPPPSPDKQMLAAYVNSRDIFDNDITTLSTDINNYLNSRQDFRGTNEFNSRASYIYNQIGRTREALRGESGITNQALKYKLIDIYSAEMDRVKGIYDGVVASKQGHDYRPGFQRGSAAAQRYDMLNNEFNQLNQ